MQRSPLARYVPPLLIIATCTGCPEKEDTGRLAGDMTEPSGPDIEVTPSAVDFGAVMVGEESTAEVTVCNQGDVELTIADATLMGGEPFSVGALEAEDVAPGDCSTLTLAFAPQDIATFTDTLVIASNDRDTPGYDVPLDGVGVGED